MNKVTRILLAIGLILAVAAPAFAEFKLNGVYRAIGYVEEKKAPINSSDSDGDSQAWIDQRLRLKATYSLNDNVAVVYFAEIDTPWGEESKGNIGDGGQVTYRTSGADGVNVETKNAYLDLKFGDTTAGIGIQGVADSFESIVANDDMAAVQVTHKMNNLGLKFAYSKWDEDYAVATTATTSTTTTVTVRNAELEDTDADGIIDANETEHNHPDTTTSTSTSSTSVSTTSKANSRSDWDDFDFYLAEANYKFSDNFKAGAGVYFMDDNRDAANNSTGRNNEVWFYGLNAGFTSGNFGLTGFAMMQDGSYEDDANNDYDYFGWAASAKATYKLENGDLGLRLIYFSEDDDDEDNGSWQGFQGEYAFVNENQMQFLTDKFVCNDTKEIYAQRAIYDGYGLMAVILSGNHKLPSDMYLNWGAGYYMAADDKINDNDATEREGDTLGYEIAARFGKKYFEKVDVSLNASYADYGDFYDETTADGDDPDATYKTYLMVNVPF